MGNETPAWADLAATSPDLAASWGVWCSEEQGQVGDELAGEEEAVEACQQHSSETGHRAQAVLVPSEAGATTAESLAWPFCIRYAGRRWQSAVFHAPSTEEAAGCADAYVALQNRFAQASGFPALFSAVGGLCETS